MSQLQKIDNRKRKRRAIPIFVFFLARSSSFSASAFQQNYFTASKTSLLSTHQHHLSSKLFADTKMTAAATASRKTINASTRKRIQITESRKSLAEQFRPRYAVYEKERLHGPMAPTEIRKANPKSLPSTQERLQLTDKITRLLNFELEDDDHSDDQAVADRATVHAKLSDHDLLEASDAVSKPMDLQKFVDSDETIRKFGFGAAKGKVTATVVETGRDTIKQYIKSITNHQVLSPEDMLS
mmetsp:Transcript_8167/g.11778  ORF Transcript_8167/g.11778 Transcript_8167/m.11778 type:complete len:241 (+) Transcript_8167:103-825(+)